MAATQQRELLDEPLNDFRRAFIDFDPAFGVCIRAEIVEPRARTFVITTLRRSARSLSRVAKLEFRASEEIGACDWMVEPGHLPNARATGRPNF